MNEMMQNFDTNNAPLLKVEKLTKIYTHFEALSSIDLTFEKGKIIGLLGPNGSGKTTLMKIIAGLLTPTYGSVQVCGMNISKETKALVSYLPDKSYLNDYMKVYELVQFFQDFYADFDRARAEQMLDNLRIDQNQKLKHLSKGTQEKVQLILVMSRNARLYVLDEPIGGVDPASRDYILDTIIKNYNPESTVIISTHLISDIEKVLDQVVFIKYGKIVLNDDVDNIREEHNQSIDALFREVFKC